jgi:hypothetical protein
MNYLLPSLDRKTEKEGYQSEEWRVHFNLDFQIFEATP